MLTELESSVSQPHEGTNGTVFIQADNHKGQPCPFWPNLICQEGFCDECQVPGEKV